MRRLTAFLALFTFLLMPAGPSAQRQADPCTLEGVARIVAVGDIHGAYDGFVRILRAAGVIDGRDRWSGGATHLVQTGDVLDRGADSRRAMDLLRRLERDAPKKGGRVLALVGNHEVMRLLGDMRDVSPAEIDAFRTARSSEIRDEVRARWLAVQREQAKSTGAAAPDEASLVSRFNEQTPLGLVEMLSSFSPEGDYGKWIRGHAATVRINGILFLHGGISARVAPLGCAGINAGVRADLTTGFDQLRNAPQGTLSASEDGPLWYRGLARSDETFEPELKTILDSVQARAIVIGHTVAETGRITPRFGGRVVQIDTGMLTQVYKGGRPSALEIVGDEWTAIYEDGRQPLR